MGSLTTFRKRRYSAAGRGNANAGEGQPTSTMITKSQRYREILVVLARHGIGVVDDHLIKHEAGDRARAEHLRRACEELGTLFIKLGQVLSTRDDLLPDAYRAELAKLQDEVVPLPATAIAEVIREDLGSPPDQLFASFDLKPLGSASIGQVHAARLRDGREVVLKVRKPGVDELVPIDLAILAGLIDEWSPRFPVLVQYDARGLLRDFADALLAELDYGREAANARFFRDAFAHEHGFTIPAVIDEYSKKRVLMEERVQGRKTAELADLPKRSRAVVARRIARFVLEPAFERGVFYADPHPGNLLVQEDGSLSIIDFGKVGHLTPETRRRVADMFIAIARSDAQRLTDRLIEVTAPTRPIDRDAMTREIDRMLVLYVDVSLEHLRFGDAIGELLQVVRRHGLRVPGTLVQFFKALAMCEGILQAVDPDSSFADYLQPMTRKLVYQTVAGAQLPGRLRDAAVDAAELSIELPRRIDRVLGEIERGNLRVWTRVEDVEPLMKRVEHLVARANATILAAACIVGLAIVMLFYRPHGWDRWIGAVFWIAVGAALIDYVRTLLTLRK
jgi:ubiquinone biosynthesis protein